MVKRKIILILTFEVLGMFPYNQAINQQQLNSDLFS